MLLLRDLHAKAPINLCLVTRADPRVLQWYRFRKHRLWSLIRWSSILFPIVVIIVEPPQNADYDVFYTNVFPRKLVFTDHL